MNDVILSNGKKKIRVIITGLSWLFFICIIVQVFLAGIAIFVNGGHWHFHETFVRYFDFIPIVMLILSFFGGMTKAYKWQCFGLFLMIIMQYVTASLSGSMPYLSALHPIIALILFWRSLVTAQEATALLRNNKNTIRR